jgi:hypothetical protein
VLGILFVAAFVKTPDRLLRTDVVRK